MVGQINQTFRDWCLKRALTRHEKLRVTWVTTIWRKNCDYLQFCSYRFNIRYGSSTATPWHRSWSLPQLLEISQPSFLPMCNGFPRQTGSCIHLKRDLMQKHAKWDMKKKTRIILSIDDLFQFIATQQKLESWKLWRKLYSIYHLLNVLETLNSIHCLGSI